MATTYFGEILLIKLPDNLYLKPFAHWLISILKACVQRHLSFIGRLLDLTDQFHIEWLLVYYFPRDR